MHLQEVIIDGFKSYAQRTVVTGWDEQFNAITGLNGSGKSNILDAICFVLGISNLTQVRAASLQDLIYKQGQAGITKATVTLVFNNSDPRTSPLGQELCETISVTRQIVLGGRNKYMINGHTVEASRVHDMFQSVGLNVNNPHFLIMQGRITKVLNMKPPEILGLIEEAAGTRMFEAKKAAALKTIEKKADKVGEITKVLDDEITPQLKKLREERVAYLRWAANNTEVERLAKFCVAYDFTSAERTRAAGTSTVLELTEAAKGDSARAKESRAAAAAKEKALSSAREKLAAKKSSELVTLTEAAGTSARELVSASTAHKHRTTALDAERAAAAAAERAMADGIAAAAALGAAAAGAADAAAVATRAATSTTEVVRALQEKVTKATAGFTDDGAGGAASAVDALSKAKSAATALAAEVSSREMRVKAVKGLSATAAAAQKSAEKEGAGLAEKLAKSRAAAAAASATVAKFAADAGRAEAVIARRDELAAAVTALGETFDNQWSSLAPLVEVSFETAGLGKAFNAASVRGTIAQLVRLRRDAAAGALETVAGGKLFQLVVDNELTAKNIIENGRLKKRVTMLPLTRMQGGAFSAERVAAAAALVGSAAAPALSLVGYPPELQKAFEYVFGNAFICDTSAAAEKLCWDKVVRAKCVTLNGDVSDPAGTLEGGSAPASAASEPLLLRLERLARTGEDLDAARAELEAAESKVAAFASAVKAHAAAESAAELSNTEVRLLQARVDASALGAAVARVAALTRELADEEAALATAAADAKKQAARVADLEAEVKNAGAARESRIAAAEAELKAARKTLAAAEAAAKKAAAAADKASLDLEAGAAERAALSAAAADRADTLRRLSADVDAARVAMEKAEAVAEVAKDALNAAKAAIAEADAAARQLAKDVESATAAAEEADAAAKKKLESAAAVKREAAAAEKTSADLLSRHPWISSERAFFDRPHSDYDFTRTSPTQASARLTELEKQQADLERNINKKVMGMIEGVEREYSDLRTKKGIIENDKSKIEHVIAELDEKKNEALRMTWAKVNTDFGSIFSTLLPGVHAKLVPSEDGRALTGLEVKVSFNGVWKESLTELSGGQRSLLALSLILSLLLFKPAPMYILDEVDAALDLSHTQNIGHMIRTHFSHSQFIVVSLKQDMFSNANVIFRTKFVEGTSTVLRTVPATSALVGGKARALKGRVEEEDEGDAPSAAGGRKEKKAGAAAGGGGEKAAARAALTGGGAGL